MEPDTTPEVRELRSKQRFVALPPLHAMFGATEVFVLNLGEGGLQVEHSNPLKLGSPSSLIIRLQGEERLTLRGRVVWSRLSKTPNERGKYLYRSGIRLEADADPGMMHQIITRFCQPEAGSLDRKRKMLEARAEAIANRPTVARLVGPAPPPDIARETILIVQQARDRLRTHPDEAVKWYNRAKFALAEKSVREAEELQTHNREDVLAVWEFLERSIPIAVIGKVFDRIKS